MTKCYYYSLPKPKTLTSSIFQPKDDIENCITLTSSIFQPKNDIQIKIVSKNVPDQIPYGVTPGLMTNQNLSGIKNYFQIKHFWPQKCR